MLVMQLPMQVLKPVVMQPKLEQLQETTLPMQVLRPEAMPQTLALRLETMQLMQE
jgi:hypothetical protein